MFRHIISGQLFRGKRIKPIALGEFELKEPWYQSTELTEMPMLGCWQLGSETRSLPGSLHILGKDHASFSLTNVCSFARFQPRRLVLVLSRFTSTYNLQTAQRGCISRGIQNMLPQGKYINNQRGKRTCRFIIKCRPNRDLQYLLGMQTPGKGPLTKKSAYSLLCTDHNNKI